MRTLLLGYKEHGKGTFARYLNELSGITSRSSSLAAATRIYDLVGKHMGYKSVKECWEGRRKHRELWFTLIKGFNTPNATWLAEELFKKSQIYDGMRSKHELEACLCKAGFIDRVIWLQDPRKEKEEGSMDFDLPTLQNLCDENVIHIDIINNNGSLNDLYIKSMDYLNYHSIPITKKFVA